MSLHLKSILTKREQDCFLLVIEGKSNKVIADILAISQRTVEGHVERLKEKLNCSSKSAIFDFAIEEKLISINRCYFKE